jgi:hypothetical protein
MGHLTYDCTVTLRGQTYACAARWGWYGNGRPALQFIGEQEPLVTATVNLADDLPQDPDEIALNHDVAADLEASLLALGWIEPSHRSVHPEGSYVPFRLCRLTAAGRDAAGV